MVHCSKAGEFFATPRQGLFQEGKVFSNAGNVRGDQALLYSSNLFNLIDEFWNEEEKKFDLDFENEILKGCVITHGGEIVREL